MAGHRKAPRKLAGSAKSVDYERTCAEYSWQKIEQELTSSASRGSTSPTNALTVTPKVPGAIIWLCAGSASKARCAISPTAIYSG